jgi:predicted ATPase/DNA-binding SARP family transcriptional activator
VVLECLALRANSIVTSDLLVEAIWAEHLPATPAAQLQVYVANLRRVLNPNRSKKAASERLASRSGGYLLTATEEELDLLRFREQVATGELAVQSGDLVAGADALRLAVELFEGQAFPDLADLELFRPELEELEEARLKVQQDLVEVELALGRHGSLVGELQSLLAQQPYRERLWAFLVVALYRCDRQADALATCRRARQVLVEELGIDPGPRLRELERLVLRQDLSLAAPATDGHRRIRQKLDNLPAELTPMVGREDDLSSLCSLLVADGPRLVTVTGPGGTGKTRLAVAAARHLVGRLTDGACWVDLAPLTQVQQVPSAIAAALGLEDWAGAEPLKVVIRFLRPRQALLVLDNFEHLEEAWPVVVDMLTAAPDLRILTTSRRSLGLRAEHDYELTPLALPPLDPPFALDLLREVAAVKLLLTRGRIARPHLHLDVDNAGVLIRLCHRLDGIPLAIELAAAQLRYRSEQVLLDELEVSFTALPAAFRDLPDRQRTLAATIAWSYQLLGDDERQLFEELGVFAGNPTVEAVSRICSVDRGVEAETKDLLAALAHHSLLRLYTDSAGASRVSILQSIRESACDALRSRGRVDAMRRRHAEYYLGIAATFGPRLGGPGQAEAYDRLNSEAPDLRGALLWAADSKDSTEIALKVIAHLWHYWELTEDVAEQCRIAVELLAATPDAPSELRAPALSGTATLCWMVGRRDEANDYHQQALRAFRHSGDDEGAAWTTMCLAVSAAERDDPLTATRLAEEALSSPHGNPRTRVAALIILSRLAFHAGDHERALQLCGEAVELARTLGDRWLLGAGLTNLAESTRQANDYDTAEALLLEALGMALDLGSQGHIAGILESLADVHVEQHRFAQAIRVLAAADAYRSDRGLPLSHLEGQRVEGIIAKARTEAGPIRFGLAWASGQALTLGQVTQDLLHSNDRVGKKGPDKRSSPVETRSRGRSY